MITETIKYALPILLVSIISASLVVYGWMKKSSPMGKSYAHMMLVITIWMLLYSLGLMSSSGFYRLLSTIEYFMILSLPFTWLIFAVNFAGLKKHITLLTTFLLSAIPFTLFIVSLVNASSGLLYDHHEFFNLESQLNQSELTTSFWFQLHVIYSLVYFIVGTVLVLVSIRKNPRIDSKQGIILAIGVIFPWIGNITFIFRVSPNPPIDPAPYIFVFAGALLAWGVFYNKFLSIVNIAQKTLIERMTDGLIVIDSQNWVLDINLAAQSIFRTNRNTAVGQPLTDLLKDHHGLMPYMSGLNRKNQEVVVSYGQRKRYYSLDVSPLYAGKGLFVGKFLLFKEITDLKETTTKWETAKGEAEQANNLKSAFLANMSHEIKTPMNAIIGFSELLNDESVSEDERKEFIDHIKNSGSNLLQLIDDLIDSSKLETGQIELQKSSVDLSKLMAELFAKVNEFMIEENINQVDLILNTHELDQDLIIFADAERIRQVMYNLLNNAVKFTKQGRVEFGYQKEKEEGKTIKFFVKDTGIGIPVEEHNVIFERFGRVGSSNRQEYRGTGLGLSLSKGLVKLMGGRIWFDSIFGKGSSFYFNIPFVPVGEFIPSDKPLEEVKLRKPEPIPEPEPIHLPESVPEPILEMVPEPEQKEETVSEEVLEPKYTRPERVGDDPVESIRDHIKGMPEEADLIFDPKHAPTTTIEEETDFTGAKLLVIEFDDMSYLFMEMILRPTNIQLIRAKTFTQGINLLRGGSLIIGVMLSSDIPDDTLPNACRQIKFKFPRHRIVAITPFASEKKRKEYLHLGCTNVLPKPLKQRELLAAVQNLYTLSDF